MNNTIVIGIILALVCVIVVNVESVNAQQNNTTGTTNLNFTKILAGKAFENCIVARYVPGSPCSSYVEVLYQGKKMLVLQSMYVDVIWKAVEIARENGYTIDGISNYASNSRVETLVAMSK